MLERGCGPLERDLDSPSLRRPHSLFFTASGAEVATSGPARLGRAPDAQAWQCCKENWLEPGQYLQTLIHTKPREAPQLWNPSKPLRPQDFSLRTPCPAMIMCVPLSLGNDTAKGRYSITASYTQQASTAYITPNSSKQKNTHLIRLAECPQLALDTFDTPQNHWNDPWHALEVTWNGKP